MASDRRVTAPNVSPQPTSSDLIAQLVSPCARASRACKNAEDLQRQRQDRAASAYAYYVSESIRVYTGLEEGTKQGETARAKAASMHESPNNVAALFEGLQYPLPALHLSAGTD
jgi:hypothetical protein